MSLDNLPYSENVPDHVNVVIEIPAHGATVKYEVDKDSGTLTVDRFMGTAMFYPCNYGFMPRTLSADGGPVDVLEMIGEVGEDHKVLTVSHRKLTRLYDDIQSPQDSHAGSLGQHTHFFEQCRAQESGEWVAVENRVAVEEARGEICSGIQRYKRMQGGE